ncbi:hypothetical protein SK128_008282, partial [Halocaridina rubra]
MAVGSVLKSVNIPSEVILRVCVVLCYLIIVSECQFRNDQDPEYNRYDSRGYNQQYPLYTTPSPVRTRYSSGDTYYGTDRRYDTHYDDPTRVRDFDNRYQEQSYRYGEPYPPRDFGNIGGGRYDSRGRERPGYDGRQGDNRNTFGRFGVLDGWRPEIQGEQRPSETP